MISLLARDILQAGLDDWVPLAAIDGLARRAAARPGADAVDLGVAAIRELVERDLAVVGEVSDGGFFQWPESLELSLDRIATAWRSLPSAEWGFICWLDNTPAGDELARTTGGGGG